MRVMKIYIPFDPHYEFFHVTKRATLDGLLGDEPEPTLDLIEPGSISGCEMNMEARTFRKPGTYFRMFVSAVVIHYHVYVQLGRDVNLNMA